MPINAIQGAFLLKATSTSFTIKVGERVSDICKRLSARGLCSSKALVRIAGTDPLIKYPFVPPPVYSMKRFEGLFSPGGYTLPINSRKSILYPHDTTRRVLDLFLSRSRDRFKLLKANGSLSVYQQIILASIVEKEAVAHRDYCKIASVFFNRLNSHMSLDSCPTLEYALGYHRPFLTRKDTMFESPYNLYRHKGLPPTPIATFSDNALWCVMHPNHTRFYFFVYDWVTGECYFAHSYREHLQNVQKARMHFAQKYGKEHLFERLPDKFYEQ